MSLPGNFFKNIRVHADGDFFSGDYFLAWMEVARRSPERLFYAYTKNLPVWVRYMKLVPSNFVLTASRGGKWDNLIDEHNLRNVTVIYHPTAAKEMGLLIDHDDSLARADDGKSFALLIHGAGAAGSEHNKATSRLRKEGVQFSYPGVKSQNKKHLARKRKAATKKR